MKLYKIVQGAHLDELETKVNKLMKLGWKCKGGMIIQYVQMGPSNIFQTMVRKPIEDISDIGPK